MEKGREILTFTKDEACNLVFGDSYDFDLIETTILDTTRWSIIKEIVIQRKSDKKYFLSCYSIGATEQQDQSPYEYDKPIFSEVVRTEKTVIAYCWPSS